MKTLALLLTLTAFAASAQTIRIADNNATRPTGANIYATLQAAIDAAVANDIVFVQPSPTNYGPVTINKKITLQGIGFNTGKDVPVISTVGDITLTNRSDNSSNASGTIIEGLQGTIIYLGFKTGSFNYTLQNITIRKCNLAFSGGINRASGYMPADNITINNCFTGIYFEPSGTLSNIIIYQNFLDQIYFGGGSLTNAFISNNIINRGNNNRFGYINSLAINSLVISNNNFLGENDVVGSYFMQYDLQDAIVSNNIFYGCAPNGATGQAGSRFERNSFLNNLTFGTAFDALPPVGFSTGVNTGSGNKPGLDPLFINVPFNTIYNVGMDFGLQATSPAKNAGTDGSDIGITGGAFPLVGKVLNGRPVSVPVIMQFNPSIAVPQNQPVKANIKAKGN